MTPATAAARLFIGIFPAGIVYADRAVEQAGDYKRLALLPFRTLSLDWEAKRIAPELRAAIEADAAKIQARRGELFQVSGSGQTVRLGVG